MKLCSSCKKVKNLDCFFKRNTKKGLLQSECKDCVTKYKKLYKLKFPQKVTESRKKTYNLHKDITLEKNREYKKNNKNIINAINAKRRATKVKSTPPWLTKEQNKEIKQIYKNCPEGYEVDHIIPLRGKEVRGLHVPWNLQYLTKKENMEKRNKIIL